MSERVRRQGDARCGVGMDVEPFDEWDPVRHEEPGLDLVLIPVVCRRTGGALEPTEHVETGWFEPAALRKLAWSPADIPVMERWIREQS